MPKPKAGGRLVALVALCLVARAAFAQPRPDALRLYREGRFEEARAVCMAELEENPDNIESYVVLTWSLVALGRYADAELYATRAYERVRRDPRIVEILGEAAYYQGKNEEALAHFQSYINLLPDGSRMGVVYYFMGEIYIRKERWGHADIALRTALQYEPRNARWWTRMGYARERGAEHVHALAAYEEALRIDPSFADARQGRERMLSRLRN